MQTVKTCSNERSRRTDLPAAVSLSLAERSVPRYTSYPTAPHFSPAVQAGTYAEWLSQLPADASLSLYLHVPYCTAICHYCGCQTKATRRDEPVRTYADYLLQEIALVQQATAARSVHRIHWGGGTPSILGGERLSAIFGALASRFDLRQLREHAIELDPRYVTFELAEALAHMRVKRASLGVQDLSPHVQQAIGRIQPFSQVVDAVAHLHRGGIVRLNFDLMYGLPRQSVEDAVRSAERAASLRPASFAVFGYAHVPWLKTHQRLIANEDLPGASERLEQFERIREVLTGEGYRAIGLDHFALADDELTQSADSGRLHRNFQGYTTDEADALIGLGASAIGSLPQGFIQNSHDIARYERRIAAGEFATTRGLQLSGDDRVRAAIIERLMCDFAVDLEAVAGQFGIASGAFSAELERLSHLPALVDVEGQRVAITRQGEPFARLIAAEFDAYLQKGEARHSRAV